MVGMAMCCDFALPVVDVMRTNNQDNCWYQKQNLFLVKKLFH
jgi:hypothetical protein